MRFRRWIARPFLLRVVCALNARAVELETEISGLTTTHEDGELWRAGYELRKMADRFEREIAEW